MERKDLRFLWTSESMFIFSLATDHLGSSIHDWGGGPWGKGELTVVGQAGSPPT